MTTESATIAHPDLLVADLDRSRGPDMPADGRDRSLPAASKQQVKVALDIILALACLVLLAPLMVCTALAIAADTPGPVFFRQRRGGLAGRPFTILKFRTMSVDSDDVAQARPGDRRVTRVGALLRRSSLDELPQLLNVLRGEMSLVGPRPHALAHDAYYRGLVSGYALRQRVKPGMTGWAQVNGRRGETARLDGMIGRVEHDLWYIENLSLALDLWILFRTVREVMRLDAY